MAVSSLRGNLVGLVLIEMEVCGLLDCTFGNHVMIAMMTLDVAVVGQSLRR